MTTKEKQKARAEKKRQKELAHDMGIKDFFFLPVMLILVTIWTIILILIDILLRIIGFIYNRVTSDKYDKPKINK